MFDIRYLVTPLDSPADHCNLSRAELIQELGRMKRMYRLSVFPHNSRRYMIHYSSYDGEFIVIDKSSGRYLQLGHGYKTPGRALNRLEKLIEKENRT